MTRSASRHAPAPNIPAPIFRNPRPGSDLRSWVIHWNEVAINASGFDHTPVAPGENRVFGEQVGPGRSARAMAIVHIAVFDSIIAVNGGFKSYTGLARVDSSDFHEGGCGVCGARHSRRTVSVAARIVR